ncbi:MAG: amidohydrolase family protein [Chloroflexi bacterium]|nr:amidohydrolase family protein [Chloroflexota bacterium]
MTNNSVFIAKRVANASVDGWLADHAVVVKDGLIADVTPRASLPGDIADTHDVHDLGDVSLLPGLIDAHSHMHCSATLDAYHLTTTESLQALVARSAKNIRNVLLSGTTTLRDIGSKNEVAFPIRDAVRSGVIPGPRLLLAGTPITTTAGHCWFFGTEADTEAEVVRAVRNQKKLGAEIIKIMATGGMFTPSANPRTPQYPASTLRAAVVEAERLDMQIVAHTLAAQGVKNCVEAGIHHLIHARWYPADVTQPLDFDRDTVKRLIDNGQWVDPTFGHHLLGKEAVAAGLAPPRVPHPLVAASPITEEDHIARAREMHDMGVRFTTGLDMGMAHADFARSASNSRAFVKHLGFSEWEAIAAATKDTAAALRLDSQIGTLEPGKVADLVSMAGDPAGDIENLERSVDVIQGGTPVKLGGAALV